MFSSASTALGSVVVDSRGRTVYVLTADGHTNMPCDDASGCTKVWPDLPFPDGVSSAKAGTGIDASKLSSLKESDGETYPTYNGWLMYEFAHDTGAGQTNGEGIHSFGGTWYALTTSGTLVQPAAASSSSATTSGGYNYP
jgi:predicted lipoprotein with Yx(FWY)xxD motif